MNIRLTDNYELRRVDSLNWRMYERRGVKKRESKGGKRTGEVQHEWVALDCFPRTVESACVWILENGEGYTRDESLTLEESITEYREIADELTRNVKRYAEVVEQ